MIRSYYILIAELNYKVRLRGNLMHRLTSETISHVRLRINQDIVFGSRNSVLITLGITRDAIRVTIDAAENQNAPPI